MWALMVGGEQRHRAVSHGGVVITGVPNQFKGRLQPDSEYSAPRQGPSLIPALPTSLHSAPDPPPTLMSSMATSPSNFQSILDAALDDYHKQTGIDLTKHPFAEQLQNCHSSDDVVQLFLERETSFKDYREKYRKLIDCLRPVVKVIHALSGIIGEGAGLVSDQH